MSIDGKPTLREYPEEYIKQSIHALKIKVELDPNAQITGTLDGVYDYHDNSDPGSRFSSIYTINKYYINEALLEEYKLTFIKDSHFPLTQLLLTKANLHAVINNIVLLRRKIRKKSPEDRDYIARVVANEKRLLENYNKRTHLSASGYDIYDPEAEDEYEDSFEGGAPGEGAVVSAAVVSAAAKKKEDDARKREKKVGKDLETALIKENLETIKNLFFKEGKPFVIDGIEFNIGKEPVLSADPIVGVQLNDAGSRIPITIKEEAQKKEIDYDTLFTEFTENRGHELRPKESGRSYYEAYISRLIASYAKKKIKYIESRGDIKKFNIKYVYDERTGGIRLARGALQYYKIVLLTLTLIPADEYFFVNPIKTYCLDKRKILVNKVRTKLSNELRGYDKLDDILPDNPQDAISSNYKNYIKRAKAKAAEKHKLFGGYKYRTKRKKKTKKKKKLKKGKLSNRKSIKNKY